MILEVEDINTFYGKSQVLFDLSLAVDEGEVVTVLGRNGVGKSTALKSIMGINPPRRGHIRFNDEDITEYEPYQIFHRGIGYVPQGREVFGDLTVIENLRITGRTTDNGEWSMDDVFALFPEIERRKNNHADTLSGGEQQMLAIGRVLMGDPELLLLDEPSEGLAPTIVENIRESIQELRDAGHTILLVEQNLDMAMDLGDRHYIVNEGQNAFEGTTEEIEASEVVDRYLTV